MDLDSLTLEELKKLHKEIERAIASFEARRLAAARSELEARAKELGVNLKEVLDVPGKAARRSPVQVKYRNPNNPDETWAGRGRKPSWLVAALSNPNTNLEDFSV